MQNLEKERNSKIENMYASENINSERINKKTTFRLFTFNTIGRAILTETFNSQETKLFLSCLMIE